MSMLCLSFPVGDETKGMLLSIIDRGVRFRHAEQSCRGRHSTGGCMKFAAIDDLIRMREQAKGVRVSIYMPAVGGADFDKNRIRFKTLVGRAEKELKELAMPLRKLRRCWVPLMN